MDDPLSELIFRILDETNSTDTEPEDDKTGNSTDTGDNSTDTGSGNDFPFEDEIKAYAKFGYVILAVFILACLCCTWRCCKRKRDRRNLELDSARADSVLGGMEMIPTEEVDEDAELI